MSWLVAVLSLSVAAPASESAVVLVSRRTSVTPAVARTLVNDASKLLEAQGVTMSLSPDAATTELASFSVKDTTSCGGKLACLAELGRQLKAGHVVLVSIALVDAEYAVGLELLRVSDETVVETDSVLLPKKGKLKAEQLSEFGKRVIGRLKPAPVDTPKVDEKKPEAKLEPREPAPPVLPTEPPPAKSHVPSFVLGGAGAAALIAGATLLIVAGASRAQLTAGEVGPDGRVRSSLTWQQAQAVNDGTTPLLIGGLAGLAAGVGLGTAAVVTW